MGAFLRQIAALGVLTTLCELLLPEGTARRASRMMAGLLTMTVLLGALGMLRPDGGETVESALKLSEGISEAMYREAALRSLANQAAALCERMARGAGYEGGAMVYLHPSGALSRVELALTDEGALISRDELAARIADALNVDGSLVRVSP
ncbi:MAG: hypothetical protein PHY12_15085 [Eubacteriales bacterium]|nr:hypothetical protein [Eubacteriales bacterium]